MLDNEIQIAILESLHKCYPNYSSGIIRSDYKDQDIANLHFLKEQGFVNANLERTLTGSFIFEGAAITAKGINYLNGAKGIPKEAQQANTDNKPSSVYNGNHPEITINLNSANSQNERHWDEKPVGKLGILLFNGIIVAFALYLISFHLGISI